MPSSFHGVLPAQPAPIHGRFDFLTDQNRQILQAQIALEDAFISEARARMTLKLLFKALTDYKLSMHCILNSVSLTSTGGINAHNATVVKAFVFSTEHANLLGYVPNFLLVILAFVGFVSVCC